MEPRYLDALLDPAAYDEETASVALIQTHVSVLFLTDRFVYKIKKPVDFGFLNFLTLDRRRFYCEEEVRLNRRLCPGMYLGVVEVRESPAGVCLFGEGAVVDYAVKMKRLPAGRMLDQLLEQDAVGEDDMRGIARIIADFHLHAEQSKEIDTYGSLEVIRRNWSENFLQMEPFLSRTLSRTDFQVIRAWVERFMAGHGELFAERVANGFIRDCDGDIHSENICLADRVYIFDCIEFNARFRFSDTAADLAFLLMDLEYRGRRDLAEVLLQEYCKLTGDCGMTKVLDFYRVYRSFVRGKVESFRLDDPQIDERGKDFARQSARRHFRLARGYIRRRGLSPVLVVFSGLMGAGKSTLARELSFELGLELLSSDMLRKELAGLSKTSRCHDRYNQGIYSREFTRDTYREMFRRAEETLAVGRSVIMDASFSRSADRSAAVDLARRLGVRFCLFHAWCPEEVSRERLEEREAEGSDVSDGRWALFSRQKNDFESLDPQRENWVEIDTSLPLEESLGRVLPIEEGCET
ncbi:MAG: kinase [Deltaproteobacteria bacterium]|nr:kinase [Deltaproteobacteria bacterium]TLN01748.1 MAG: kinase [bacterium]